MADDDILSQFFESDYPEWAFWWESNSCWGWVASPEDWEYVKSRYDDGLVDPLDGRTAIWTPISTRLAGIPLHASFGFRREHQGEKTVADHATEYNLGWMLGDTRAVITQNLEI
jgi:hypothetical protein